MINKNIIIACLALTVVWSCGGRNRVTDALAIPPAEQEPPLATVDSSVPPEPETQQHSRTARLLDSLGYVNISDIDPSIAVYLVYATPENFMGQTLYEDLTEAYLLPEAAEKLVRAQRLLKEKHPGYSLIVYDAARPMSVQREMWDKAVRTGKQYYVANPAKGGGLHNYGAAVDVSLLDENGNPLSMGTVYDHLGSEANIDRESELVRTGIISRQELDNRLLLRETMRQAGFRTVISEWWHFNHCSREEARRKYQVIDF